MSEKSDAEEHLEDVLVLVQLLSSEIGTADTLRPQLDTILMKIPLEMMEKVRLSGGGVEHGKINRRYFTGKKFPWF